MRRFRMYFLILSFLILIGFGGQQAWANAHSVLPGTSNSNVVLITLSKKEVVAGTTLDGTVSLATSAPFGGSKIPLFSENRAIIVPESVTVPFGATKATFTIRTEAVEKEISAAIKAGSGDTQKSAILLVKPLVISSLTLSANQIVGGTAVRGTVLLNGLAPATGYSVGLSSGVSATASVPSTVTIPAGRTSVTFDINTSKVNADTSVSISAFPTSSTTGRVTANLTVTIPLIPEIVSMTTNTVALANDFQPLNLVFDRTLSAPHTIQLSSSNQSVVSFPLPLTIEAGKSSHQLIVPIQQVAADTSVTITAVSGNSTKSVTLTVRQLSIQSLTFSPSSVVGGNNLTGTVVLSSPRFVEDTTIQLIKNDNSVTHPISTVVRGGQTSAIFEVSTNSVAGQRNVSITASIPSAMGGNSKTASFTILPVSIVSISLETARCNLVTNCPVGIGGSLSLDAPAPPEGLSISLSSDRTALATVPSSLLIPAGATTVLFSVTIQPNAPDGPVIIRAMTGSGSTKSTTLELEKTFLEVESVSLNATIVEGGTPVTGTVNIGQYIKMGSQITPVTPTTFPVTVNLGKSPPNYSGGVSSGTFQPATLNVPPGQLSGQFTFTPAPTSSPTSLQISASRSNGSVKSTNLIVSPATIQSLNLSQTEVQGGQSATLTIQMSGPVPYGNSVAVTSSDTNAATVIGSGFFSGSSTGTFTINTSSSVTTPTTVTITASFAGQTMTTQLTVNRPSALSSISLPASRIFGGSPTNIRVELDGPAPSGGSQMTVTSSLLQVIALINTPFTIPAGQNSVTIPTTPNSVGNSQQLNVRANYQNQTISALVTIEPLNLDICNSLLGQTFVGGTQINCTLTVLNNGMVAPEGGIQLSVQNSNPGVLQVPATFIIPAGQNNATLQISTQPVSQSTSVQITFSIPGFGHTRSFTITPP